jgi:hypothetical protein
VTRRRAFAGAAALVALAVVHAVLAGGHYFVGSFDDDAGYIIVARALAHGRGLTSMLPPGVPLVAAYPPGYAALLAPIAFVDAHAYLAFRALSLACLIGLFPLTWIYLGRRGVADPARLAVLALLALSPVLATFGTMVMAELPFALSFVVLVLAADGWDHGSRWAGAATLAAAITEVWIKEAAVGLVAGLVLWLVLRRQWAKAATLTGAVAVSTVPILVARARTHVALLGSRYSLEFGGAFAGGVAHRLTAGVAHAVATYANLMIPQTIVPTSTSPLPTVGPVAAALGTLGTTTTPLVVIGFAVWARRHRDATCVMIPLYLLETLVYPFINERRLVLVLPVLLAWYVLGAWWLVRAVMAAGRWWGRRLDAVAWAPAVVVAAILVAQLPRDYLFKVGQSSSKPQGSAYMGMLRRLGRPSDVVETDYVWTTNLFTGHRTGNTAYLYTVDSCWSPSIFTGLRLDGAGYLLSGQLTSLPNVGSPCLLQVISSSSSAVRLLRTVHDDASVFELIGPGTVHPDLVDLAAQVPPAAPGLRLVPAVPQDPEDDAGTYLTAPAAGGGVTFSWIWSAPTPVVQVSVGHAGSEDGTATGVTVELQQPDGRWRVLDASPGAVGQGGAVPFLLAQLPAPMVATALRVRVRGTGILDAVDVHALAKA